MYDYQNKNRYFALVAEDLKDLAQKEIETLGAEDIKPVYRGLYFNASPEVLYTINFHSRLINRVLAPLISFKCHSDRYLYKMASQIKWEDFLTPDETLAVFATVNHSAIRHSKFAALRVKDAIVDYFRSKTSQRPSINTLEPNLWINLYINNNEATISLDTSGGSLHRRGYREKTVPAPMIETLASAIIKHSNWSGEKSLYDPFCGSGTFLCEAYLQASHTPTGIFRKNFGFKKLPDFNLSLWKKVKEKGLSNIKPINLNLIKGSDISSEATTATKHNLSKLFLKEWAIIKSNIFDLEKIKNQTIICNPPYGKRMGTNIDLNQFYKELGDFLKKKCQGSEAYIYFGNRDYIKKIGLKPSWKKPLTNGGLDGRLVKYELY